MRGLTSLAALWLLLCVNRVVWLLRPDGSGHPMVEYRVMAILRAISLEWIYGAPLAIPIVAAALWYRERHTPRAISRGVRLWLIVTGFFTLVAAIVDMEVMRFLGGHLTVSFINAYANRAAGSLAGSVLRTDPGGPYVGPALLVGSCLALALWHARASSQRHVIAPRARGRFFTGIAILAGGGLAAYITAFEIGSPPRRTRWRVAPVAALAIAEWRSRDFSTVSDARLSELRDIYRHEWQQGASHVERARWIFPEPEAPYFRITRHAACARPDSPALGVPCDSDFDRDNVPLAADCNDFDPSQHPGARDIPGDGRDQDCTGLDADPWNIVLIVLESHRAATVGHLGPWGAQGEGWTPALDQLASRGVTFARASSNGLPSIAGFMSIHTGLEPHPSRYVATDFTRTRITGLPDLLRDRGFATEFVSVAPPEIDNETFWGRQWYDGIHHAKAQLDDRWGFARLSRWIAEERPRDRPFLATLWTGTHHVPFEGGTVPGAVPPGLDITARYPYSMRWVDAALGDFLRAARQQPWFARTVFVVTGDHGFPLGEHGSFRMLDHLWGESTWVPLVIAGDHPELVSRRGIDTRVASHVDIAPTILDLVGAEPGVAFTGHSLLPADAGERAAVTLMAPDIGYAVGDLRLYTAQPRRADERGDELYDTSHDQLDGQPIADRPDLVRNLRERARARSELSRWVYSHDRLLPAGMTP